MDVTIFTLLAVCISQLIVCNGYDFEANKRVIDGLLNRFDSNVQIMAMGEINDEIVILLSTLHLYRTPASQMGASDGRFSLELDPRRLIDIGILEGTKNFVDDICEDSLKNYHPEKTCGKTLEKFVYFYKMNDGENLIGIARRVDGAYCLNSYKLNDFTSVGNCEKFTDHELPTPFYRSSSLSPQLFTFSVEKSGQKSSKVPYIVQMDLKSGELVPTVPTDHDMILAKNIRFAFFYKPNEFAISFGINSGSDRKRFQTFRLTMQDPNTSNSPCDHIDKYKIVTKKLCEGNICKHYSQAVGIGEAEGIENFFTAKKNFDNQNQISTVNIDSFTGTSSYESYPTANSRGTIIAVCIIAVIVLAGVIILLSTRKSAREFLSTVFQSRTIEKIQDKRSKSRYGMYSKKSEMIFPESVTRRTIFDKRPSKVQRSKTDLRSASQSRSQRRRLEKSRTTLPLSPLDSPVCLPSRKFTRSNLTSRKVPPANLYENIIEKSLGTSPELTAKNLSSPP